MMAVLQTQDQSNPNGEYLAILSQLAIGKDELQRVVAMLLEKKQTAFVQSLIASQVGKSPCLELLGELATSRAAQASFDPADLWRAWTLCGKAKSQQGLRSQSRPVLLTRSHCRGQRLYRCVRYLCTTHLCSTSGFQSCACSYRASALDHQSTRVAESCQTTCRRTSWQ